MRRIALVNQKGGCGKTTTAINLASCLAEKGKKILLIDLDPQGHSAMGLGVKPEQIEKSVYEVLLDEIPMSQAIRGLRENFDAVFSNVVLSAFEQVMAGAPEREYQLSRRLEDIENHYDYLIIDSPPSIGLLTFNGLMASEEAIIPVDSSYFSLHGLGKLLETIQLIREKAGHELSMRILAANIDRRTNFGKRVVLTLTTRFPKNCFETVINTCTRLREAASHGKPIAEYDTRCAGSRDYQDLTREILNEEPKIEAETLAFESPLKADSPLREPRPKEIEFTLEAPDSATVEIAGDFNNWTPERLHLTYPTGRCLWQKLMLLSPGSYQYKYVVDGQWISDPDNEKIVDDSLGGVNSVVHV
jgi:chromosome partitioning protein